MRTKQELYQAALRTVALRRQTARANAEDIIFLLKRSFFNLLFITLVSG